ncbi:MAG: response regulator transcription factor [Chloroflexi bacterium]|nr:response regulator transcription factor [Chloroflexota bacterium]
MPDRIICGGIECVIQQDATTRYSITIFDYFETLLHQANGIHILLMDISGLSTREVEERFHQLNAQQCSMKVIVISSRLTAIFTHRVMQFGAKGFIYRDDLADNLLHSLDLVRRDVVTLSPSASQLMVNSSYLYMSNEIKPLDMQVLRLMARGLTVKAIAIKLHTSTRSIYRSRDKLREILNIPTIETLVDAAREQGLLDLEAD